jgi:glycosyltransferase involved in cell wall biosynthesis
MKILCVIDSLGPGGAQRQLVELALGFQERGNEVSFLTYHDLPFYNKKLENAGIQIHSINEPAYIKRIFKARRLIRKGNYDAVLSFLEGANCISEFAGIPFRSWKLVVGERNADPQITRSIKLIVYRWFHVFADFIVANSNANIQLVRTANPLLRSSKCKVIYNTVDTNRWKPLENFVFRKNSKITLVIAASHIYRKNLNGLIDALALMPENELAKINIEWYGDRLSEPYYDPSLLEAKEKIARLKLDGIITFHPATDQVIEFIQKADAIGLFSFIEGLPNIICEGMACAKPAICSTVSDVPFLLSHNENLLCNPNDPQSIKHALSYLINLNQAQLNQIGAENEKICKRLLEKEIIISEYLNLLKK